MKHYISGELSALVKLSASVVSLQTFAFYESLLLIGVYVVKQKLSA